MIECDSCQKDFCPVPELTFIGSPDLLDKCDVNIPIIHLCEDCYDPSDSPVLSNKGLSE